jgi:hypothetical protein
MATCELLMDCLFFNQAIPNMPFTSKYMRKKYCLGCNRLCILYILNTGLGTAMVPDDIYPNDHDLLDDNLIVTHLLNPSQTIH